MNAICFRCSTEYKSEDPDDLAGDGKCPPCKELSKSIAFKVDIEIAERRRNAPPPPKTPLQMFTEHGGRINMRDLGINPNG